MVQSRRYLIWGDDARAHLWAWRLQQASGTFQVYCHPGNPGTYWIAAPPGILEERPSADRVGHWAMEEGISLALVLEPDPDRWSEVVRGLEGWGFPLLAPPPEGDLVAASLPVQRRWLSRAGLPLLSGTFLAGDNEADAFLASHPPPFLIRGVPREGLLARERTQALEAILRLRDRHDRVLVEAWPEGRLWSLPFLWAGGQLHPFPPIRLQADPFPGDPPFSIGVLAEVDPHAPLPEWLEGFQDRLRAALEEAGWRWPAGFLQLRVLEGTTGEVWVVDLAFEWHPVETAAILGGWIWQGDPGKVLEAVLQGERPPSFWAPGRWAALLLYTPDFPEPGLVPGEVEGLTELPEGVQVFHHQTAEAPLLRPTLLGPQPVYLAPGPVRVAGSAPLLLLVRGRDREELRDRLTAALEVLRFPGMRHREWP